MSAMRGGYMRSVSLIVQCSSSIWLSVVYVGCSSSPSTAFCSSSSRCISVCLAAMRW